MNKHMHMPHTETHTHTHTFARITHSFAQRLVARIKSFRNWTLLYIGRETHVLYTDRIHSALDLFDTEFNGY